MNLDYVEAIHLVQQLGVLLRAKSPEMTDVVVAPPFVDIRSVTSIIEADRLTLTVASQHAHFAEGGAFTGEVSVQMLKRLGVKFVIVGHSERRTGFGMSDEIVRATLDAVLAAGLSVILCCGEDADVRDSGEAANFVTGQIASALVGVKGKYSDKIILAYEPIWAIGTGRAADAEIVREMIDAVRLAVPSELRDDARVLYGGSVKANNAADLISNSGADGFLVGGASLQAEEFMGIVNAVDGCYRK
jgi:triosephosphate isomerase